MEGMDSCTEGVDSSKGQDKGMKENGDADAIAKVRGADHIRCVDSRTKGVESCLGRVDLRTEGVVVPRIEMMPRFKGRLHYMCGFTHKGGWIHARRGWIHTRRGWIHARRWW